MTGNTKCNSDKQNCYIAVRQDFNSDEAQVKTFLMAVPVQQKQCAPVGRFVPLVLRNVPCPSAIIKQEGVDGENVVDQSSPNNNNTLPYSNSTNIAHHNSSKGESKGESEEYVFQLTCDPNDPELECNKAKKGPGDLIKDVKPYCPVYPACNFDTRKFGVPLRNVYGLLKGRELVTNNRGLVGENERKEGTLFICFESC